MNHEWQRKAVTGARHDWAAVYADHADTLWRVMYAFTAGQRQVAEDAISEAFARGIANDAAIDQPLAWLITTARRLATSQMRHPAILQEKQEHRTDALEHAATLDLLLNALRSLSPNQRLSVVLRYYFELSVAEAAELTGMAEPTVRVHAFRGRERLRKLLDEEELRHV